MPVTEVAAVAALGVVAALAAVRIVSSFVSRTYRRCAACAGADRMCDFTVVIMSTGMAAMIVAHDEFPATIGVAAFGISAGWFAFRVVKAGLGASARSGPGSTSGFAFHHLLSCAAMVVMSLTVTGGWHQAGSSGVHHAAIAPSALIWGLGTYFVVAAASAGFVLTSSAGRPATSDLWREREVSTSDMTSQTLQKMQRATTTVNAATPMVVRAVTSRAGVAGSEVVMSAAMALMLFQAV